MDRPHPLRLRRPSQRRVTRSKATNDKTCSRKSEVQNAEILFSVPVGERGSERWNARVTVASRRNEAGSGKNTLSEELSELPLPPPSGPPERFARHRRSRRGVDDRCKSFGLILFTDGVRQRAVAPTITRRAVSERSPPEWRPSLSTTTVLPPRRSPVLTLLLDSAGFPPTG